MKASTAKVHLIYRDLARGEPGGHAPQLSTEWILLYIIQ